MINVGGNEVVGLYQISICGRLGHGPFVRGGSSLFNFLNKGRLEQPTIKRFLNNLVILGGGVITHPRTHRVFARADYYVI